MNLNFTFILLFFFALFSFFHLFLATFFSSSFLPFLLSSLFVITKVKNIGPTVCANNDKGKRGKRYFYSQHTNVWVAPQNISLFFGTFLLIFSHFFFVFPDFSLFFDVSWVVWFLSIFSVWLIKYLVCGWHSRYGRKNKKWKDHKKTFFGCISLCLFVFVTEILW